MEFFTIGVYHSDEETFFKKLIDNGIDTFCDIRQRRGVRGSEYTFANSSRLQEKLNALGIKYVHILELAPTTEIRNLQNEADKKRGGYKRDRHQLDPAFALAYKEKVLKKFDFKGFLEGLEEKRANKMVLFCVEEKPETCHRSIVSDQLKELGYQVTHL